MTVALEFSFLSGRVHGTPWTASHNEGAVEFPPSPWRLLRSLIATWHDRAWDLEEATVRSLIERLATVYPTYAVPPFASAHVRHYLPESAHLEGVSTKTAKVIDAFAAVDSETPLIVEYDVDLSEAEHEALERLVVLLPYLGRAESLVSGRVVHTGGERTNYRRVTPGYGQLTDAPIRLLSPRQDVGVDWGGLTAIPWKVRQRGALLPPGSEVVSYQSEPPLLWDKSMVELQLHSAPTTMMSWAIRSKGKVPLTDAVAYCDAFRSAILKAIEKDAVRKAGGQIVGNYVPPRVLSGKDGLTPSTDQHSHAHFLPIPTDDGRFVEGVMLWVPGGLESYLAEVVGSVRRFFVRLEQVREVSVFLQSRDGGVRTHWIPKPATVWHTLTPFAPGRHPRRTASVQEWVESEVRRELKLRSLPDPLSVTVETGSAWGIHPLDFRRYRNSERLSSARRSFHVSLEFADGVQGPLALGALSHFGLGYFTASGSA